MATVESASHTTTALAPGRILVWIILAIWLAVMVALADAGVFMTGPDDLPLPVMTAATAPPLLFLFAYAVSMRMRAWVDRADLGVLTAMQGWRVVGAAFLFLYAFGHLPALFAFPGGVGDVLVGLAAPFAVLAWARKSAGWQKKVFWLNVAGVLDFVVAIATGLGTSPSAFGVFAGELTSEVVAVLPVALFPIYIVPVFIILHIMSFLKLRSA